MLLMRLSFDGDDAGALYISLRDDEPGPPAARTEEIAPGTAVDLTEDGRPLGIEVLDPGSAWPLAEILRRYEVSEHDAVILMALYPCAWSAQVA
jgi:uncharacterized protein YuzE